MNPSKKDLLDEVMASESDDDEWGEQAHEYAAGDDPVADSGEKLTQEELLTMDLTGEPPGSERQIQILAARAAAHIPLWE